MQSLSWVLATYIPLEILYVAVVWRITGAIGRSSLAENRWLAGVGYAMAAIVTSGVAVLAGQLWAIGLEILRVGDSHLGYRTQFIPYMQVQDRMFLFGLAVFGIVLGLREFRQARMRTSSITVRL